MLVPAFGGFGVNTPLIANITINSISTQQSDGSFDVDYTIDINDSTVEVLLALSTTAAPDASDFGADSGGGADAGGYTDLGTVNLTVGGMDIELNLPDGLEDSYKIHLLPTNGADVDVESSDAFDVDTTAPVFSSSTPADNATGVSVNSTIDIVFDETVVSNGGDFYLYDVDGTAVVETFTAGGSGDNGGTINISTTTVTLTPGAAMDATTNHSIRWDADAVVDSYGNGVAANSGDTLLNFQTGSAVGTLTVTEIGSILTNTSINTTATVEDTRNYGAAKTGKVGIIVVGFGMASGGTGITATINGGSSITPETNTNRLPVIQAGTSIFTFDASAGGNFDLDLTPVGGAWRGLHVKFYTAEMSDDTTPTITGDGVTTTAGGTADLSLAVLSGDVLLGVAAIANYTIQSPLGLTGISRDGGTQYSNSGSKEHYMLEAMSITTTETRTVTLSQAGGTNQMPVARVRITP